MAAQSPSYLALMRRELLHDRVVLANERLRACDLCPRRCGVDRLAGELGYCRAGLLAKVASCNVHMWEEPPISGSRGSGTIFFSYCTARCIFCQNYPISQLGVGQEMSVEDLARQMLLLQSRGCHNINLVTPTHFVPQILAAIECAALCGLAIPIVYNSSGYDSLSTVELLDGIVDIYLPDAKYADDRVARELSGFQDYVAHNRVALFEMRRQVGDGLQLESEGIAVRGLVVRHLVLPAALSQTGEVLTWIANRMSRAAFVSLMAQYFPAHQAVGHSSLGRRLTKDEYEAALVAWDDAGLELGWRQDLDTQDE